MKYVSKICLQLVVLLSLIGSVSFAQLGSQHTFVLNPPNFSNYPTIQNFFLSGGNIFATGSSYGSGGASDLVGVVSKTDTVGNLIWTKAYRDPNLSPTFNMIGINNAGANFIVTGGTSTNMPSAWASVINGTSGAVVTGRFYNAFANFDALIGITAKPLPAGAGGAYAIAGKVAATPKATCGGGIVVGSGPHQSDLLLIKTDANLDTIFCKRFSLNYNFSCGLPNNTDSVGEELVSDFITTSSGFVFCGKRSDANYFPPHNEGFLLATDFSGNVLWSKTYYYPISNHNDYISSLIQDGTDYMVIGTSSSLGGQGFVMRVGPTGSIIWCNTYSGNGLTMNSHIIKDVNDGNFLISGLSSNNGNDLMMFKIDANGNVINAFTKSIGRAGWSEGVVASAIIGGNAMQSSNGTYFLCGPIDQGGTNDGFMVARLHKSFYRSGCNEVSGTVVATSRAFVSRDPAVRVYGMKNVPAAFVLSPSDYTNSTVNTTLCTYVPLVVSAATVNDVSCKNGNNGSAQVNATGGNPDYTYSWSNGAKTITSALSNTETGLANGTYTVTITEGSGYAVTTTATINQPATSVSATAGPQMNASCPGGQGSVGVIASGGTPGYSYSWSLGSSAATVTGVNAGTYTVTVTDLKGCISTTTAAVTVPSAIVPVVSSVNATCGNATGSASISASGGTSGYSYTWSNGGVGATITGLAAAGYTVTITDANGCTTSTAATVNNAGAATVTASTNSNVSCFGGNNGSAAITTLTGGTPNYTYSWSNGVAGVTSISNLTAGSYTISVLDANGCLASSSVSITQPTVIAPVISSSKDETCTAINGTATATATGGIGNFTYSWSNGAAVATVTGLAAATYTVSVTDANNCTITQTVAILNHPSPVVNIASSSNLTCFSNNTGTATANISGGTLNYTISWLPAGGNGMTATGLAAGTYTINVTDANNCVTTSSVTLSEPTILTNAVTTTNSTCSTSNGIAVANVGGGTPGYTYNWNNGATSQTASGLVASGYVVTVTDAKGCTKSAAGIVSNSAAANLTATVSANVLCHTGANGAVSTTTTGGTSPFTYSWSNGTTGVTALTGLITGSYTVSVIDANGCLSTSEVTVTEPKAIVPITGSINNATCGNSNGSASVSVTGGVGNYTYSWSSGSTAATAGQLVAGSYTITVTDNNGCPMTSIAIVNNLGAATLVMNPVTNAACNGGNSGSASVTATGGTPPLTYSWTNGSTGATATGLQAGIYTVAVRDINGCLTSSTASISEPTAVKPVIASAINANCGKNNGSVAITVSGGTGVYTYLWSNGITTATNKNIVSGSYTVTVKDANGCSKTASANLSDIGAATLSVSGPSATICIGQSATLTATIGGGVAPYTYSWSNGLTGPGPQVVSPVSTTTYTVAVTDSAGCVTAVQSVKVSVNPPLSVGLTTSSSNVCDGSSAVLTANASGGNGGPYTYSWQPGAGSGPVMNITPTGNTTYTVIINDNCGTPIATAAIPVTVSPLPTVGLSADKLSNCGAPFCVQFTETSSAACNSIVWKFGDSDSSSVSNPTHCFQSSGSFDVSVKCTDAKGCSTTTKVSNLINVYPRPKAEYTYSPDVLIQGSGIDFINQSTGAINYFWHFNDPSSGPDSISILTNPIHTFKDTGLFCVKLFAASLNCADSTIKCLKVNEKCTMPTDIPNVFSPNEDGMNDLFNIKTTGLSELICTVYNRWGMKIYEYNAVHTGWDGRTFSDNKAPVGTYFYILNATCISGDRKEGKGFVELMR